MKLRQTKKYIISVECFRDVADSHGHLSNGERIIYEGINYEMPDNLCHLLKRQKISTLIKIVNSKWIIITKKKI